MPRKFVVIFTLVLLFVSLSTVNAQQNLLNDGGFETQGDYKPVATDIAGDGTEFTVPQAWGGWALVGPGDPPWQNRVPTGFPHTGLFKYPAESSRSFHVARGYATFTAAIYQRVTVPDKANVRGTAFGFMERKAGSNAAVPGASFKVGIDPTGGTDPLSSAIIWSATVSTADSWQQATVDATATGTAVTLFLYATQSAPSEPNGIYWDSASLVIGGGGGTSPAPGTPSASATPVIPTAVFAPFVGAQPEQSDGSIVHTVQPGDTLAAIAVAYGVTSQEILDLNGMTSGRFLQIGQKLIIRPAAPSSLGSAGDDETEEADPDATEEPTVRPRRATETSVALTEQANEATATPEATETEEETEPTVEETVESASVETEEAEPTETPPPATATEAPPAPVTQVAQVNPDTMMTGICVSIFDDANQNRIQEEGENLLADGSVTVRRGGQDVETYQTDGESEPFCLTEVEAGDYIAVASPPEGYGLTTSSQLRLLVQPGVRVNATFGAAEGVEVAVIPTIDAASNTTADTIEEETVPVPASNPIVQNLGLIAFGLAGAVLVVGLLMAVLLRRR